MSDFLLLLSHLVTKLEPLFHTFNNTECSLLTQAKRKPYYCYHTRPYKKQTIQRNSIPLQEMMNVHPWVRDVVETTTTFDHPIPRSIHLYPPTTTQARNYHEIGQSQDITTKRILEQDCYAPQRLLCTTRRL